MIVIAKVKSSSMNRCFMSTDSCFLFTIQDFLAKETVNKKKAVTCRPEGIKISLHNY